jgi:3-deoxy-D-manno-octulosonic-acid transferase
MVGPNLENFKEVVGDFLAADAVIQVPDAQTLSDRLGELLADRSMQTKYGERAAALVQEKRGSLERTLKLVAGVL